MNDDLTLDLYVEEKQGVVKKAKLGVPSILMIVFVFAMSAFGSLVQLDFDWKELTETALWSILLSSVLRVSVYFCSRWVGASTRYQRDENSEEVTSALDKYSEASKNLPVTAFAKWAEEENRSEKERVYRDRCNAAILALERKILYIKRRPRKKPMKAREKHKLAMLEYRQSDIRERCSDEYIAANLAYIKVKYDHITPSDFMEGNNLSAHPRKRYSYDASKEISIDTSRDLPIMLLCSLGVSLIAIQPMLGVLNIVAMLYDVGAGIINFYTGWFLIGASNTAKAIAVYNNKRSVLVRFKERKIAE